jgi:hypothetical protein
MNRKDLIFAAIIVAVIGVFVFLSVIGKKAAPMLERPEHMGMSKSTSRETCFQCHAPDSNIKPMPPTHPIKGKPDEKKGQPESKKTPCTECHKPPATTPQALKQTINREDLFSWLEQQKR